MNDEKLFQRDSGRCEAGHVKRPNERTPTTRWRRLEEADAIHFFDLKTRDLLLTAMKQKLKAGSNIVVRELAEGVEGLMQAIKSHSAIAQNRNPKND